MLKQKMERVLALLFKLHCTFTMCLCLDTHGMALLKFKERVEKDPFGVMKSWNTDDHCSWYGVECLNGRVIVLRLKDLCLEGTLAPELGKLTYIKSIILRNNSFSGNIPKEILELEKLEVLDLGYNNFSGTIPSDLAKRSRCKCCDLVDNNRLLSEQYEITSYSKSYIRKKNLQLGSAAIKIYCNSRASALACKQDRNVADRRLLQASDAPNTLHGKNGQNKEVGFPVTTISPSLSKISPSPSPSISLPPKSPFTTSPENLAPSPRRSPVQLLPPPSLKPHIILCPSPGSNPSLTVPQSSKSKRNTIILVAVLTSVSVFAFLCLVGIYLCRSSKIGIKPWSSGLSEQLQKALVVGVPKLQRSELVTACEDFSNVIGSISDGTVYKGTLSSGVEIAVTTTTIKSAEYWSNRIPVHKEEVLSTVNHKNFMNLIGYCKEEDPFTRMMVFEYAPNGTLFEHLYVKESEHLDWGTRIRIAMGMAYCLDYMHDLTPALTLNNLHSSSVFLTEDYAAKISNFTFWNEMTATKMGLPTTELLETSSTDPKSNVYSFGVVLFELITGKLPYSVNTDLGGDWAADYLKQMPALKDIVDPTLRFVPGEEFEMLAEVIKACVNPDAKRRPNMKEVTDKLKEITDMGPNGASPKLSPLWWAELEISSSKAK